jgi:hypothetical protein
MKGRVDYHQSSVIRPKFPEGEKIKIGRTYSKEVWLTCEDGFGLVCRSLLDCVFRTPVGAF